MAQSFAGGPTRHRYGAIAERRCCTEESHQRRTVRNTDGRELKVSTDQAAPDLLIDSAGAQWRPAIGSSQNLSRNIARLAL
jgi:hypothetical protein